ncbi:stalk domain-containing protein [Bacillus sp. DTU_2020_1000418_1_SI_GHA_SEK_038]|uniref:stalk domain-containing protein n=1 Tax=Bacillus sp. DTU_2020_1000418_1_SI_GHA_SEK_038 TaxID=3077585 RepID=UPI0028EB5AC7|nr:stalk domain-containing protein [Bacillus sp. DTU_2020_1000418_1_SI_GHA_SEK_038]WNS77058.1 stalk domain-containing protein [Bacillus sp. DTU_2020_1000418_1_SI_GHA_SEK_038]
MWKTFVLISIVLTTVIGGMLFWQWKAYSKENESTIQTSENAAQEITVKSSERELLITQKVTGLTAGKEYKVDKPESLFRWSCINIRNNPCESSDENALKLIPEQNELVFEYMIPIKKDSKAFLLEDWTISLPEIAVTRSSVIIVDSVKSGGAWVAGAKLKGFKEMDLIDYYYFEGNGGAPAVYWQYEPLQATESKNELFTYFGSREINKLLISEFQGLKDFPYVSVIFTDQMKEQTSNGLLISKPGIKEDDFKLKMFNYFYEKKFRNLPMDKQWVIDALASYSAKLPASTEKGNVVLHEMKIKLTEEELGAFLNTINTSSEPLTIQKLDQFVSEIRGLSTRFFTLNEGKMDSLVPLYFYDPRKVAINGNTITGLEIIFEEGKSMFPFIETMKALDYGVEILADKETILLRKESNTYRFFLNRNIFIYNEDDYGLLEKPLAIINGNIYMSGQWIETLFKVEIEEEDDEIIISY